MNARAYYNEIDPYCAQWLRNLIGAGHIAPGDVDERSIVDVRAADLAGYTQCHFFAGIGGWSYALRLAGWPDDRPVWTGSCPCQPFSAAGAGKAADDERHLWPAWFPLIAECKPAIVFGEQVEAAVGWGWLDAVFSDLEAEGYACGAAVLPACGVGAPHIRQRLWFVADASKPRRQTARQHHGGQSQLPARFAEHGGARLLADSNSARRGPGRPSEAGGGRDSPWLEPAGLRDVGELGNAEGSDRRLPERQERQSDTEFTGPSEACGMGDAAGERYEGTADGARPAGRRQLSEPSPLGGFWSSAEWIPCTDGKARPVGPGSFPLGHGIQRRASKLRAYGNAIVPQVAAEFIAAAKETIDQDQSIAS